MRGLGLTWAVVLGGVLFCSVGHPAAKQREIRQMNNTIAVTTASIPPQLLQGPVPVPFTFANTSQERAAISLPYPNPNNLRFTAAPAQTDAVPKTVEIDPIERTVPTVLEPGASHSVTYFLNRYFRFARAGNVRIGYELKALVTRGSNPGVSRIETFTGALEVPLVPASDDQLRAVFASYAEQLRSPNRQTKLEKAEALAFIDSPLVIPYLLPMLGIDNLEVIGIHALGRHPSAEATRDIPGALGHPDSGVVAAALEEIDRLQIPFPRARIQTLLGSQNPNIRLLALERLSAHPDQSDLPFVGRMSQDDNPRVRETAAAYAGRLQLR
jgi:hypothetical protein